MGLTPQIYFYCEIFRLKKSELYGADLSAPFALEQSAGMQ